MTWFLFKTSISIISLKITTAFSKSIGEFDSNAWFKTCISSCFYLMTEFLTGCYESNFSSSSAQTASFPAFHFHHSKKLSEVESVKSAFYGMITSQEGT